jgi:D-lactate dehydrogenase
MTFPNVIITGHQAFLTASALKAIADTTLGSIQAFSAGEPLVNEIQQKQQHGTAGIWECRPVNRQPRYRPHLR